ncbi:hypothetical protein QOT17_010257 [Balamuthia mandrillaris]
MGLCSFRMSRRNCLCSVHCGENILCYVTGSCINSSEATLSKMINKHMHIGCEVFWSKGIKLMYTSDETPTTLYICSGVFCLLLFLLTGRGQESLCSVAKCYLKMKFIVIFSYKLCRLHQ